MTYSGFNIEIVGLIFASALLLSLLIVPLTVTLAHKVGALDHPKERSSHKFSTTRLGGLGILASLVPVCLAFLPTDFPVVAYLSGLLAIAATGFIDDVFEIGARWKFAGQIAAAMLFVFLGGGILENLGDIFGVGNILTGRYASAFTVFCMVGGVNAFNLSDGLDGLAAGLAAIAAVFLGYFLWLSKDWGSLTIAVALFGAAIGFLRYNSYPARLFMGDSGSLVLGYTLAVMVVRGSNRAEHVVPLVAFAEIFALLLLDTLLVMARRIRHGRSPFSPDRTHLHHRLVDHGLSQPAAVATLYGVMLSFGLVALIVYKLPEWQQFIYMLAMGGLVFGGASLLQSARKGGSD